MGAVNRRCLLILAVRVRLGLAAAIALGAGCGLFDGGSGDADDPGHADSSAPQESGPVVAPDEDPKADEEPDDKPDEKALEDIKTDDPEALETAAVRTDDTKRPIELTDVSVSAKGGLFGAGALEIKAKGKLLEKIDSVTYVQAKAVCRHEGRFLTDTGFVNADYRKPLTDHDVGETVELTGRFFIQGNHEITPPCQVEFRLAGAGGGISIPLETACFDGESTKIEPCTPPVAAPAMSSSGGKPMRVVDLKVEPPALGSKGGLNTSYVLEIREPQENGTRITLKAACKIGDVTLVDVGVANLMAGPFRFESGEAVTRSAPLFFSPTFGFSEPPKLCDLQVATWQQKKGTFGDAERILLDRSCYREGRVTSGPCESGRPAPPAAAPVDLDSLEVGQVSMEVVEPYGSKGDRFQLKIQADARVDKPVDQFASVNATVTCKVGKTVRVETAYLYGVELHYLAPGETTRMSGATFTSAPMDKRPQTCEAEFTAGRRFSPSGEDTVALGKWCLRKGITKRGKC
jgi:hypothetical protein